MDDDLRVANDPLGRTRLGVVLPSQHFEPRHKHAPERRLMTAVLHEALDCLEKYRHATDKRSRRCFHEARQWLLADDEADWPYSFESICEVLDLDANAVRRGLRLAPETSAVREALKAALQG